MEGLGKRLIAILIGTFLIGGVNGMLGVEYTAAVAGNLVAGFLLGRIVGFIK